MKKTKTIYVERSMIIFLLDLYCIYIFIYLIVTKRQEWKINLVKHKKNEKGNVVKF